MPNKDIHVVGASLGGVEALKRLLGGLPGDLPATICIVLHTAPTSRGLLPEVLQRASALPVVSPNDDTPIERGRVYVARPDHHLLIMGDRLRVVRGPKENRHRPAVDPLFRSAAWSLGPRVVGVVLTGMLDDGTAGLWAVKMCGGTAIVQDPAEAPYPGMPTSAIQNVDIDHCVSIDEIAPLLEDLARQPCTQGATPMRADQFRIESEFAMLDRDINDMGPLNGRLTALTCPSCHGALWEIDEGGSLRFRCHTGHAYGAGTFVQEQSEALEQALYAAARALNEQAIASRYLAERTGANGPASKEDLEQRALRMEEQSALIRRMLAAE